MTDKSKAIADRLRELANRFDTLPDDDIVLAQPHLSISTGWEPFYGGRELDDRKADIDRLAQHILGTPAATGNWKNVQWRHFAEDEAGAVDVCVYLTVPKPAEENPSLLRARIAELEAQLAEGSAR